jgi:hypothetical protein
LAGDYLIMGGIVKQTIGLKLKPDQSVPDIAWSGPKLGFAAKNSTPVVHDGLLFGCDADGELRCVEPATGERLWTTGAVLGGMPNSGTFFLVKTPQHWVLFTERGELILAHLTRAGYKEISRAKIIEPTQPWRQKVVWNHPAFAGKSVFVRNDRELICVSLAAE